MPLTKKGKTILSRMQRPKSKGGYGKEKGEEVFYKSLNAGRIKGVEMRRRRRRKRKNRYQ
jgi:hypothetical protein